MISCLGLDCHRSALVSGRMSCAGLGGIRRVARERVIYLGLPGFLCGERVIVARGEKCTGLVAVE
jgi:hypothetical protein